MSVEDMPLSVADLPDWDRAPSSRWQRGDVAAGVIEQTASRRSVLKFVVGGALGLEVWSLEMVRLTASATNPNPILSVWGDCHGYVPVTMAPCASPSGCDREQAAPLWADHMQVPSSFGSPLVPWTAGRLRQLSRPSPKRWA